MSLKKRRNLIRDDEKNESSEAPPENISNDDSATPYLGNSQRVERLTDAVDGAERWRLHHPDGSVTDYRECWRPSWGRQQEPPPVPPGRAPARSGALETADLEAQR